MGARGAAPRARAPPVVHTVVEPCYNRCMDFLFDLLHSLVGYWQDFNISDLFAGIPVAPCVPPFLRWLAATIFKLISRLFGQRGKNTNESILEAMSDQLGAFTYTIQVQNVEGNILTVCGAAYATKKNLQSKDFRRRPCAWVQSKSRKIEPSTPNSSPPGATTHTVASGDYFTIRPNGALPLDKHFYLLVCVIRPQQGRMVLALPLSRNKGSGVIRVAGETVFKRLRAC